MLKFCLTIDCERFISFRQGNPRWNNFERFKGKINSFIKNFRYNEKGFELIYKEILKQRFPITLMLTGRIFKPIEEYDFIEWGYHSYRHIPFTLASNEVVEEQVKNIYNAKSITPPLWMVEDIKNPERVFDILKKNDYKNIVYKGTDEGVKCYHYHDIKKPFKRFGINCVHLSNTFEGNSSKERISKIKKDIIRNIGKDAVYLLSTHDFTHRNLFNLREIMNFTKGLEKENKIKIIKLNQITT